MKMYKKITNRLYLIGFMGCGKSTVSKILGELCSLPCVEMDEEISKRAGMPIPEIFETYGESHFRDLESALIAEIAEGGPCVVSCGGGAVLRRENVSCMKNSGTIVYLTAAPETIYERVKEDTNRPLLNGHMEICHIVGLMEARRDAYENAADVCVATDGRTPADIAREIAGITGRGGL